MNTIFDVESRDELVERLGKLHSQSERQWGKMTPEQMMEHVARAIEMAIGKAPSKHKLIGKLVGWAVKPQFFSDKPMSRNAPTAAELKITDSPDLDTVRTRLIELITEMCDGGATGIDGNVHGFFGRLTGKEWGELQYKHIDHHLQQFGA